MNHDPLCPTNQNLDPACWFCGLIAEVRADERSAPLLPWRDQVGEVVMAAVISSRRALLADLRARVEALGLMSDADWDYARGYEAAKSDVLDLFDEGSDVHRP